MVEVELNTIEGALGVNIVITYAVAKVPKANSKIFAENMTEAEVDALKIL